MPWRRFFSIERIMYLLTFWIWGSGSFHSFGKFLVIICLMRTSQTYEKEMILCSPLPLFSFWQTHYFYTALSNIAKCYHRALSFFFFPLNYLSSTTWVVSGFLASISLILSSIYFLSSLIHSSSHLFSSSAPKVLFGSCLSFQSLW